MNFFEKAGKLFSGLFSATTTYLRCISEGVILTIGELRVVVYEVIENGYASELFNSLGSDLNKLCFTREQAEEFCKKYSEWLCYDGHEVFFLLKQNEQFSVITVFEGYDGDLCMRERHFENSRVWLAENHHRLVVPKQ